MKRHEKAHEIVSYRLRSCGCSAGSRRTRSSRPALFDPLPRPAGLIGSPHRGPAFLVQKSLVNGAARLPLPLPLPLPLLLPRPFRSGSSSTQTQRPPPDTPASLNQSREEALSTVSRCNSTLRLGTCHAQRPYRLGRPPDLLFPFDSQVRLDSVNTCQRQQGSLQVDFDPPHPSHTRFKASGWPDNSVSFSEVDSSLASPCGQTLCPCPSHPWHLRLSPKGSSRFGRRRSTPRSP